ncbi:MAG: hypothetical protein CFH06_01297, partial [Alphaproteobacteria bacterium MarineAlpha3_Bin5]
MAISKASRINTRNYHTFLIKILLIILVSLLLAVTGTMVASSIISSKVIFGHTITANREANILFIVFVAVFFFSMFVSLVSLFRNHSPVKTDTAPERKKKKKSPTTSSHYETLLKKLEKKQNLGKTENITSSATPLDSGFFPSAGKALSNDIISQNIKKNEKPPTNVKNKETGSFILSPEEENTIIPDKDNAFILKFLGKAMEGSKRAKSKLDNFNKFGINLWLAGACERLAVERAINNINRNTILSNSVQVIGFKKSHSISFARKYEEYLLQDSRYMQMYHSGRNAMNYYLTDDKKAGTYIDKALEEWNKPKEKEEAPKIITVLFTDIAGSTAITQKLGDAGAQELVRSHNKIVRDALHQFGGREIKHTGDGIMASFNQASYSIEAAIMMQRGTAAHNLANPKLPLHLKIGINSGEPIQEDNDLFGTMVQLSARIVDKAQGDEILVSETVRGICAGKDYNFQNRGTFPMKGFAGDLKLYDVPWFT